MAIYAVLCGFSIIFSWKSQTLTDFSTFDKIESIENVSKIAKIEQISPISVNLNRALSTASNTTTTSVARTASVTSSATSGGRITIAGNTISIFASSSTTIDAGSRVGSFRKLLYGHNSSTVFGRLSSVATGSTFTVTLGGTTTTYRILQKITVLKSSLEVNNRMNYLVNSASYTDRDARIATGAHDLVLMTCAGTLYGNGNASHRTLIFADRI